MHIKPYQRLPKESWYHWVFDHYPLLPSAQFKELCARKEEPSIREGLLLSNARLVYSLAKRFARHNSTHTIDDLMNIGMLGLQQALQYYDPQRAEFSTYATPRILHYITRAISDEQGVIHVNHHTHEIINKLLQLQRALTQEFKRSFTLEGLWPFIKDAGILTEKEFTKALDGYHTFRVQHIDDTCDYASPNPIRLSNIAEQVALVKRTLSPFELDIIERREVQETSFADIAALLISPATGKKVTRTRIQQIAERALKKARARVA